MQSREFRESLAEFLEKAKKNSSGEITLPEDMKPEKVMIDRNTVEVVAAQVISLDPQSKKKPRQ